MPPTFTPIMSQTATSTSPKTNTRLMVESTSLNTPSSALYDWGQHWTLSVALESVAAYQYWICRKVMPIVFQWVDEHYNEVYGRIPTELHDDIEKIVQVAFDIVKEKDAYKKGQEELLKFKSQMFAGAADTTHINPTWTKNSKRLREEICEVLNSEEKQVPEMAHQ